MLTPTVLVFAFKIQLHSENCKSRIMNVTLKVTRIFKSVVGGLNFYFLWR